METSRAALREELLGRLRDFHEEVDRLENYVLELAQAKPSEQAQAAQSAAGSQAAADGEAPARGDETPTGPPAAAAGAEAEGQPLTAGAAPALVADIRRRLEADPVRALGLAYPDELFGPDADPRQSQRTCLLHHSVHTARLAMYVAACHGYQPSTVEVVGLCALLHDVGMERVPPSLFLKPDSLTQEEVGQLQAHAAEGAEMLGACGDLSGLLRVVVPTVVRQHHERIDGSGYPDGLAGEEIHEFARLLALVEAYETMVSPRPYKSPRLPYEAMETILLEAFAKGRPALFDKAVATSFLRAMSLYPIGSAVLLTSGEIGQVVGANPKAPDAPHVRIIWGADGEPLERPSVIDLSSVSLSVARAVPMPQPPLDVFGGPEESEPS